MIKMVVKSCKNFWIWCTFMGLQIPILSFSIYLIYLVCHLTTFPVVALLADSDWLLRKVCVVMHILSFQDSPS